MSSNSTIEKLQEKRLWEILGRARGELEMGFLSVVSHLRAQGENLSISDLMFLQGQFGNRNEPFNLPTSVARFFALLVETPKITRALDPFGGLGMLGAFIADTNSHLEIDVVTPLSDSEGLIRPLNLVNLNLHIAQAQYVESNLADSYDVIFSIPPINRPNEKRAYSDEGGQFELNDDPSLLLIADMAARLSPAGFIAFVVTPRFTWEVRPASVRRNLERLGLHLSALLAFRAGAFPGTSLAFNLAIISQKQQRKLFVAEVPEDLEGQKALVERLRKRKQGPTASQGRLVDPANFHGMAALEARERYDKLRKDKGLESVPFSSAVPSIQAPRRGPSVFEHCEEHAHAVYLPEMAATNATTRQNELPSRLKSYLQLLVDPEVVLPEYLAGWLNGPMGQALRQSAMTGVTIPRIKRSILAERKLYLPTMADQQTAIQAIREIQRMRSELGELESRLWDQPGEATDVAEAVGKLNHEERFSDWIETLPFPLASILRSYHAIDRSPKEKYERLLHFFEAFTEFCAAIHLSAFRSSSSHWQPQKQKIAEVLRSQHLSLAKASFGTWRAITELMAGNLRKMLADKDDTRVACAMYATVSVSPLEIFASANIVGALQRVNNFRNRWTGHGGAVTDSEAVERHEQLVDDLARLREILGVRFNQYQLIEARECEILEGPVFRCRIRRVMGSNPQLEHDTVDLTTPATTGRLYLHNPGHNKALELLPLVQVCDKPQPASYFYNRIEKSEPQLVSYQFSTQSEMPSDSGALLDLLQDFKKNDTADEDAQV